MIQITEDEFTKIVYALQVVDGVLDQTRFASLDQNPKGVRDLVGSARLLAERIRLKHVARQKP